MQKLPYSSWIGRWTSVGILSAPNLAFAAPPGEVPNRLEQSRLLGEYLFETATTFGWDRIGIYFLIVLGSSLLLLWPIARLTLQRRVAFKSCAVFMGSMIAITACALAAGYVGAQFGPEHVLTAIGIVFLGVTLWVAHRVFRTSWQGALIVLFCFLSLTVVGSHLAHQFTGAMPWTQMHSMPLAEQRQLFTEWLARKKAAETPPAPTQTVAATSPATPPPPAAKPPVQAPPAAPAPPPSPAVPAPDLLALYTQLQKTRATLDPNDPVAVARFNEQVAAYNQEKSYLAASAAPPPPRAAAKAKRGSADRTEKGSKVAR